mgnify:CR=1 FL=1
MADSTELLKVSLSGAMGWCLGYSVKKLGKLAAVIIGVEFLGLQALVRSGYMKINWEKVAIDFSPTRKRMLALLKALITFATYNFPFAATFAVGFFVGFKTG